MTVTDPPLVYLPGTVKRVGIINRSVPAEGHQDLARIDAILTAEGLKLDKEGAVAAVEGLADRLGASGRFETVVLLDSLPEAASGVKGMPAALSKKFITQACEQLGLDAIFTLSFYDTDTRVQADVGVMDTPTPIGVSVKVPAYQLDLNTAVRSGWRIYLPELPLPLDQWEYTDFVRVSGRGINPVEALNSIANRKERILDLSRENGFQYGGRLEPARIRVSRDYFVRGTESFVRGKRLARTGAWDAAARLWVNEINGNLDEALDWAREAYATYGNRQALRYLRVLEYRKSQNQTLEAQLTQADW
ncbi:MAG: DUF6340 family protein [Robiginitalea sp.]